MLFWSLAVTITVIACAALYYASVGRTVNAADPSGRANDAHFRLQLSEIEADLGSGRLAAGEAVAAKAELAREMLRLQKEAATARMRDAGGANVLLPVSVLLVAIMAFGAYALLGNPNLPSQPLAGRTTEAAAASMQLEDAVKAVEDRLAAHPDDVKGWSVLAPVYMQTRQYPKAEQAFRHILTLNPPTADAYTDLAESLMAQNGGQGIGEAGDLLHKAVALDPKHVRSRFYLAAEAMRVKEYVSAVQQWTDLIALAQNSDAWLPTAKPRWQAAAPVDAGPCRCASPESRPKRRHFDNGQWLGGSFE